MTTDPEAPPRDPQGQAGRFSLLAVDDEPENLNLVRRLFKNKYDVHTAADAAAALRVLEARHIDLVLCDQRMPRSSGVELLEEISERWPGTARILVTAYADLDSAIAAINLGKVRRYIKKPWDNEDLEAVVAQELQFNRLRDENERLVRDLEARNRQLLEANRKLESLERMKTGLLSSVTHELKTPLLSVQGYAEMLAAGRAGELPPRAGKYLDGILRGAGRLEELIGNLLTGARLEHESRALVLADVDLSAKAQAVVKTLAPQAEKRGVKVEVRVAGPATVTADPQALDRILMNLMSNAIKFNMRGGRVVAEIEGRGDEVHISVADTGVGIPEEMLEKIFEPFFKIEDPSTPKYGGTGLGLSIVKECVERHGGTLEARSEPGKGSIFEVTLPAAGALREDRDGEDPPEPGLGMLVVLADPSGQDLSASRAALLSSGFGVLSSTSLVEALEMARRHRPHVFLADTKMVEGIWFETPGGIPWLALLDHREDAAVSRALKSGALGCLLKPVRPAELLNLLHDSAPG